MDYNKFKSIVEQSPEKIKEYLTGDNIKADKIFEMQLVELIKATGDIGYYLREEKIQELGLKHNSIIELINATENIEKYITPEIVKVANLKNFQIVNLIKSTGNIEKYLTPELIEAFKLDRANVIELINATENIEKCLTSEIITASKLQSYDIEKLIEKTSNIEKYLTAETIEAFGLKSGEVIKLINATENIEKFITPSIIKAAKIYSYEVVKLIEKTGNIEKYLTPEKVEQFGLNSGDLTKLIKKTGNIEKYLFEGQSGERGLTIANLIKALGPQKIEECLIPEKLAEYSIKDNYDITNLIKASNNIEKYKFDWQTEDSTFTITNVINSLEPQEIQKYLTPDILYKLSIADKRIITSLIKSTGEIEKYLLEGQTEENTLTIANVIKGTNACPELTDEEIILLANFNDNEITNIVMNIDVHKQKEAIHMLKRLDRNNSGELRRIKVPIALQILEKEPEEFEKTLAKIEEIYLTNNIPTIGKMYLVFQELHPNFLGEGNKRKDDSYAKIPSLEKADKTERKHIIFSNLLKCALESNNRNIREYLELIEHGDKLYREYLAGKLQLENINAKDERIETLSKYRDILNTLYNLTSKGKRRESPRKNTGNLGKDLKELDALFELDNVHSSLPDRLVRTFAFGSNIRTFEEAKNLLENSRKNEHDRNVKAAENGRIELSEGDFVKGIYDSQYFPKILQNGILAKDFLGANATHDGTPLDTDVEKVKTVGKSFNETLSGLFIAPEYTNKSTYGKKLGSIMLVFSGDNFLETRDENKNINQENIEQLRGNTNKKEVFHNQRKCIWNKHRNRFN